MLDKKLTVPVVMSAAWGPSPSAAATTSSTSASPLSLKSIHFSAPRARHRFRFSSPLSMNGCEHVWPTDGYHDVCSMKGRHAYGDDAETHHDGVLYRWKEGFHATFDVSKRAADEE